MHSILQSLRANCKGSSLAVPYLWPSVHEMALFVPDIPQLPPLLMMYYLYFEALTFYASLCCLFPIILPKARVILRVVEKSFELVQAYLTEGRNTRFESAR